MSIGHLLHAPIAAKKNLFVILGTQRPARSFSLFHVVNFPPTCLLSTLSAEVSHPMQLARRTIPMLTMLLLSLAAFAFLDGEDGRFPEPTGPAMQAKQILSKTLSDADARDDAAQLEQALTEARDLVAPQSPLAEIFDSALKESAGQAVELAAAARKALTMLEFTPLHEAELPAGLPTYTPVGVIEVKKYPTAVGKEFSALFQHIQSNSIAMTVPVQTDYRRDGDRIEQRSMAFLYKSVTLGSPGAKGNVEVMDSEPLTVVSLGLTGDVRSRGVEDAAQRLQAWIEANPKYREAGNVRVMSYNSPFVPRDKQFFEVQLPLEEATR
jgi:hypothetical protein